MTPLCGVNLETYFSSVLDRFRIEVIFLFILRYRATPITAVIIPVGMQARPTIQNHPSDEKCMMDTPAIKRAAPERK